MTLAWHFVGDTLRDGREIPKDGEWLVHEGKVEICVSGLHASLDPFDALQYAPGHTLCLVECEGIHQEHIDKFVCRKRKILKRINAESLLLEFARWCALQVVHLCDAPEIMKRYLETGDESIRDAARDAVWETSRYAAWEAARGAAMDAARYAAWDAAEAAAWYAAEAAAWYAAKDAAKAAAKAAARDAAEAAAWDAAWYAAEDAAWYAQRIKFNEMVQEAFK